MDGVLFDFERLMCWCVVCFVVVCGQNKGCEFCIVLYVWVVVGMCLICDCVFVGEENIGKEQFEFVQCDDQVFVQNFDEVRLILINGLVMKEWELVNMGDLVGMQDIILWVMFDG